MISSLTIGAFIALWGFWVLLYLGFVQGELQLKGLAVFFLLWLLGVVGLPRVPYAPAHEMVTSWVAILDIALVFKVFQGDVGRR